MARKIICGIDDSEAARNALSAAASLSHRLEHTLVMVHVVAPPLPPLGLGMAGHLAAGEWKQEAALEAGERVLATVAAGIELGASSERRVELGYAPVVLPAVAEAEAAELIVVGTRGRGALSASLFGSVSSSAVRDGPCPVLVVPKGAELRPGPIVCVLDESEAAHRALRVARRLSDSLGEDLVLAHVVTSPWAPGASTVPWAHAELGEHERRRAEALLDEAFELGDDPGVEGRIVAGSEAEAIVKLADDEEASVIVVGARRGGGIKSALTGSVSKTLTAISPRPVLIVGEDARLPLQSVRGYRAGPSSTK